MSEDFNNKNTVFSKTALEPISQCYINSNVVVRVPEHIIEALHLQKDEGVIFLEDKDGIRIMSDSTYFALLGLE